jgi:hypothetical protein
MTPLELWNIRQVHWMHRAQLIARSDVVAVGVGFRSRDGKATQDPVIKVMVAEKKPLSLLRPSERLPTTLRLGSLVAEVDVDEIAPPRVPPKSRPLVTPRPADPHLATERRPLAGGFSISHVDFPIGTLAVGVEDLLGGWRCVLSCNHVLGRLGHGHVGDAVVQPGIDDGGVYPVDAVGGLLRYVPLHFNGFPNWADAAIAACAPEDVTSHVHGIGPVHESACASSVSPGDAVTKVGRSSGLTRGTVVMTDTSVNPNYKALGFSDPSVLFMDQIVVDIHAEYGDSGSLLLDRDNRAIGMLFGGVKYSWFNPFRAIEWLLAVRLLPPPNVWV